ncbi:hypothetical protein CI109_102807 [Kwoniella shandongensis]|uniref:Structural maintenance of chromosomes protein 5 n=1 Tax=Kwoniella shandongensis TaxID=1734106 RepID=A0A5M6BQ73_9TREE|nr:uncharacterized protein CI109_007446 [Kwoniella shandongensis]KAA5524221.1 hypothetical protein CI109_007446 [Kwoniella shandongensis]
MAGEASSSRLKRPMVLDSEDEEDDEDPRSSASPNKRRQVRKSVNVDDDEDDVEDDEDDLIALAEDNQVEDEVEEGAEPETRFRPEYERGDDGYVAGSITRIKVTNFMTYDHVEFSPGPHLNMILGPNGTGKSSIAAAIAIGLGFPPKVMGRAKELRAYVKQGCDEATVEIELKGRRGKRNTVIWRKINREDEKSDWKLNGENTTRRDVLERVKGSGIQANNLCSFLPQDKVAEFAKMAPVTVLKETMRAAGDPRLSKWHELLVEKGAKSKEIDAALETHTAVRDRLQTQVDSLVPDVEHVQEREAREHEAEVLEYVVRWAEHRDLKKITTDLAKEREAAKKTLEKLQAKRRPLRDLNEYWDAKQGKADTKLRTVEERYKDGMKHVRKLNTRCEEAASKGRDVDTELGQLRLRMERKENEKASMRARIQDAQAVMNEPREEIDAELRAKGREKSDLQAKSRHKRQEIDEAGEEYEDNNRMFRDLNRELEELTQRQRVLGNVEIQKENAARDFDGSINFMLDWLVKEAHTLDAPVHKPPMISVSVPNQAYAWQVEAITTVAQRKTFICTSRSDYDRLIKLNGTMYPPRMLKNGNGRRAEGGKVALHLAYVDVTDATVNPQPPCAREILAGLGFDGYAVDFVEADPAVIAFLCSNSKLHATAVTQRSSRDINSAALLQNGIRTWVTRDDITRATQSNYGRKEFVERTEAKTNAKAFNLVVDHDAVKKTVEEIAKKKKTKLDREAPHSALKDKMDKLTEQRRAIEKEVNEVDNQMNELKMKAKRYNKAQLDMENCKDRLRRLENEPSAEVQRDKLKKEKLKFAKARLGPMEAYLAACDDVLNDCAALVSAGFGALQASANHTAVSQRFNAGDEEFERQQAVFADAQERYAQAKVQSNESWTRLTSDIGDLGRSVRNDVSERVKGDLPPSGDLRDQLQTLRAQLEMGVNISANVVTRWEKLSKELDSAKKQVEEEERDSTALKREIKKTLDQFDPALETLAKAVSAKFAAAFQRVKCTGEVRIRRVEGDFASWGIEILVSYRDEDSLAILTGSHQSGGERSLATVTYLMSLSEMSRTPFSLVDEINQGMDQRAERAVHNQLVEVTCESDAGQYFLITPKLLTGLTYHPKMKVLIINNGTHLPDSREISQRYGNLKACIKRYQQNHSVRAH